MEIRKKKNLSFHGFTQNHRKKGYGYGKGEAFGQSYVTGDGYGFGWVDRGYGTAITGENLHVRDFKNTYKWI